VFSSYFSRLLSAENKIARARESSRKISRNDLERNDRVRSRNVVVRKTSRVYRCYTPKPRFRASSRVHVCVCACAHVSTEISRYIRLFCQISFKLPEISKMQSTDMQLYLHHDYRSRRSAIFCFDNRVAPRVKIRKCTTPCVKVQLNRHCRCLRISLEDE
jgi:hypothetical protein